MALTQVNSEGIKDGEIKDADVNASAAIAGSKLAAATTSAAGSMSAADKTKLDGVATSATANPSAPALTGSTNNTICTVTGANAIQGEGNLTFDGNLLTQTIDASAEGIKITAAGNHYPAVSCDANRTTEGQTVAWFEGRWNGTSIGGMSIEAGDDTTNKDDGKISFYTTASGTQTKKMAIEQDGNVEITDGDLVIGTSGHGIDFSATGNGTGANQAELLDDYETGTWTPNLKSNNSTVSWQSGESREGQYTKIGRMIYAQFAMHGTLSQSYSSHNQVLSGLPFTSANVNQIGVGLLQDVSGISYASGASDAYGRVNASVAECQILQKQTDGSSHSGNPTLGGGFTLRGMVIYSAF